MNRRRLLIYIFILIIMKENFIEAGKWLVYYLENYKVGDVESQMDDDALEILFKYLKGYKKRKWTNLDPYSDDDTNELQTFTIIMKQLFICWPNYNVS